MPTYKLTIEYEGTRYSGWQAQGNTPKTIQGHLLRAAMQVLGDCEIGGAGRTDSGVHAAALHPRVIPIAEHHSDRKLRAPAKLDGRSHLRDVDIRKPARLLRLRILRKEVTPRYPRLR